MTLTWCVCQMNILFGEVPDEVRYLETVDKCCLLPDFDQFGEARDQTEIGEKGACALPLTCRRLQRG